jgi:hypothetical protein
MIDAVSAIFGAMVVCGMLVASASLRAVSKRLRRLESWVEEEAESRMPPCDPIPSDAQWRRIVSESRVNSLGGQA